jgi:energy-coupling factor transporter ATP-binding protein EcfA2
MTGVYELGGKRICINSVYDEIHKLCRQYSADAGEADFLVETSLEDIAFEREKSRQESEYEGLREKDYDEPYLETLAVYRKIAERMPDYDTMLFHGSCVAVDGSAFLFTAPSGTGKSTHTRLWRQLLGERAIMVNDDKPLLKVTDEGVIAYGTPYNGKHRLGTNTSVPLKAICILTRSADNHIEAITREQAYTMLLQQVYRPADMLKMAKTLELVDRLADSVKLYKLGCNMEISAAQVAYEGM